ncbi:MAG: hypothetical protein HY433_00890 [Candidatus Liptonbacteria bacterium]|nr:hypothetical protein [Candidatus Liptonbacteria bacterium]
MRIFNKLNVAVAGLGFYLMNGLTAMAQTFPRNPGIPSDATAPITSGNSVIVFVNQIAVWVSYLFWALAVIFIFYAAFLYLTAGGEEEKIKKANHQLIYAVIAIVVALFAYGMPLFVKNILGNQ